MCTGIKDQAHKEIAFRLWLERGGAVFPQVGLATVPDLGGWGGVVLKGNHEEGICEDSVFIRLPCNFLMSPSLLATYGVNPKENPERFICLNEIDSIIGAVKQYVFSVKETQRSPLVASEAGLDCVLLALLLLLHARMGPSSFFRPYIAMLPSLSSLTTTLLWTDDQQVVFLQNTPLLEATRARRKNLTCLFVELELILTTQFPGLFTAEGSEVKQNEIKFGGEFHTGSPTEYLWQPLKLLSLHFFRQLVFLGLVRVGL
jgi:hypothetical protein